MSKYDELKKLAEVATPGPWSYDGSYICPARVEGETTCVESWSAIADSHQAENVRFIAAANPAAILQLIAENERLAEQCKLNDLVHGPKGRERLAILLKADADRASYWKQRAKSAEGHLYAGDMQQAARELHKRTSHSDTPWDQLTVAQRAQIEGAVLAVVAAVNAQRDSRQPSGCEEEASK